MKNLKNIYNKIKNCNMQACQLILDQQKNENNLFIKQYINKSNYKEYKSIFFLIKKL